MKDNVPLLAFNRGVISKLALARTDIKRTALSAEIETNWLPRVLGSMMLRPGWQYLGETNGDKQAVHIPFIFAQDDTAILELTDLAMRVYIDDALISRVAVSTAISNGDFGSATNWTDADEGTAVSNITGGKLNLTGTKYSAAIRRQTVTVSAGDQPKEHALRIVVDRGPVTLRVGTTSGGDELVTETSLSTGTHSIAFTPGTGTIYVQLSSLATSMKIVDSCEIEAAGVMSVPAPWLEDDLLNIRTDQSADVIYAACNGYSQYKIERRSTTSWSVVRYEPEDGPFRAENISSVRLTPSARNGDITLTSSRSFFKSGHVGSLFKLKSSGQVVSAAASGAGQWTSEIRITGNNNAARRVYITIAGTWSGTVTIQRSIGEPGNWVDLYTYTTNQTINIVDELYDQIVYWRIGIDTGDYTSGTANVELSYAGGSLTGIVRVTGFTNATTVSAAVLKDLGGTSATELWSEGDWSDYRGEPTAVALYEGRLFWAGRTKIWGSVSDAYESFDDAVEGDSAPLNRSIGSGPIDDVNWLMPLNRLVAGTAGAEVVARSSSFDEPLTVSNFNLKAPSTQGSANVNFIKVDAKGFFVGKSGNKLFQMIYNGDTTFDYESVDMMELAPEIGNPGIIRVTAQRQPDTRIHCVRSDGKVAVLISQPAEEVLCWMLLETDGAVEDAFVMPGLIEDKVYYVVRRVIGGVTKRFLEKWSMEDECQGGLLNKQADSFIVYDGVPATSISVPHLIGEEVVVWADGKDVGVHTVSGGGTITLATAASKVVAGLYYEAPFKSTKLAYAAQLSTALGQSKRLDHLGLVMSNIHHQGLKYGKSFDKLDNLPKIMKDKPVPADTVFEDLDTGMFEFPGDWDSDSRLCLLAAAPRPCTLLAAIVGMKTNG